MAYIIAAIITLFAVITIISVSIHTSSITKPGIKFRRKVGTYSLQGGRKHILDGDY